MKNEKKSDSGFDGRKSILDILKMSIFHFRPWPSAKKRDFLICDHYALILILRNFFL